MTESEWIDEQYEEYGEDFVHDLMDNGYTPVHTQRGWRWVLTAGVLTR